MKKQEEKIIREFYRNNVLSKEHKEGYNKALDEVMKMIERKIFNINKECHEHYVKTHGYEGRTCCDDSNMILLDELKEKLKELRGK